MRRSAQTKAAIRVRLDVRLWQTNMPCVGTNEPLELWFDRPFDRHLLDKDIRVIAGDKHLVIGDIVVGSAERSWRFLPSEPWSTEEIQVIADTKLEDVAANNFRDPLDHVRKYEAVEAPSTALQVNLKSCRSE